MAASALRAPGSRTTALAALAVLLALAGCAPERVLKVRSEPAGALVRLDEEIIGQTPLNHDFDFYGTRRLTLYLAGYRTWSEPIEIKAPWHARFPIDVVTEVLVPIGTYDEHEVRVKLEPDELVVTDPDLEALLERAWELRSTRPELDDTDEASTDGEAEEAGPPPPPEEEP